MKKYLNNRNKKLFNKLFENQGIKVKEIGIPEKTAWLAKEESLDEESEVNTAGIERLLTQISDKLDTLDDIDISIDYLTAALTGIDPDVANKGQAVFGREAEPVVNVKEGEGHVVISPDDEDDEEDSEDYIDEAQALRGDSIAKIQKTLRPVASILRTVDTPQETAQVVNFLLKHIAEMSKGQLTKQEMMVALKNLVQDLNEAKASKIK
tara:strand:- start:13576 stop:14202 length:627 start_codon:yes stop_codon:yes gene_type:complete